MRYMPIAPVGMLDIISDERSAFILPQLWSCEDYRRFYVERDFDIVIVDNGVYENAKVDDEVLLQIAKEVSGKRVFVTLPERMYDAEGTIIEVKLSLDKYNDVEKMVCLQGKMIGDLEKFRILIEDIDAIAVPVWMYRKGWCRSALREWLVERCDEMEDKYWHAFGCDNLLEVKELKKFGYDSIDTSMPFTAAVNRIDFEINMFLKNVRRVNLLGKKFDDYKRRLAIKNLKIFQSFVR